MIKKLEKFQMALGVIFLSIFFIAILTQIITRYLGISVIWTEEVANYSFIWAIFMGAAVMVNRREHFSFDFLTQKLHGKKKAGLLFVIDLIVMIFAFFITIYGYEAVTTFWNYNWLSLPELKMGYIWIAIPIMGITMMIYSINHIVGHIKVMTSKGAV
ncbi:TRAP transporter small permease [Chryseomicrobium palamuruense]